MVPGFPAANASLAAGDIITDLNGTATPTWLDLVDAINQTTANQTVALAFYSESSGTTVTHTVTLAPLSSYTHLSSDKDKAFLGVAATFLTPVQLRGAFVNPFASSNGPLVGAIDWLVLPLAGLQPLQGSTVSFFHIVGPLSGLGTSGFWVLANLLFWLSWMNLLLGMSNALPLVPLDGGLLFRDFAASVAHRLRRSWDEAKLDRFSGRAVAVSSVAVIFLLVWQFIAPHL